MYRKGFGLEPSKKYVKRVSAIIVIAIIAVIVVFATTALFSPSIGNNRFQYFADNACSGNAYCFRGTINRVIDGDTIAVGESLIRLSLTSTPELDETHGLEAKEFTMTICPVDSDVLVDEDDGQMEGSYGRILAKVYCNGTLLNSVLLEEGLATIDTRFCSVSEFASEDWAKKYGC